MKLQKVEKLEKKSDLIKQYLYTSVYLGDSNRKPKFESN